MKNNTWKEYWSSIERSFIEKRIQEYKEKNGYRKLLDAVKEIGESGKVIEIGAGRAWISRLLRKRGWHTTAIDLNEKMVVENSKNVDSYINGNIYNIPFKKKSFDLVISCGVIEHFNPEELRRILLEMKRVGRVVVAWLPAYGIEWKVFWQIRNKMGRNLVVDDVYRYKKEEIQGIFKNEGFRNVKVGIVLFAKVLRYYYVYGEA